MKSLFSIAIILVSLALLIPGVTLPILSISGTIEKSELTQKGIELLAENVSEGTGRDSARGMLNMFSSLLGLDTLEGEVEVFQKTRSIWSTINELQFSGNLAVAILVMLFSVIVPAVKLSLMLMMFLPLPVLWQQQMYRIIQAVGKWSMADVFVVALIITYMAGNASAGMGELLRTHAQFEPGFYYFSAYCLFSIMSSFMLKKPQSNNHTERGIGSL